MRDCVKGGVWCLSELSDVPAFPVIDSLPCGQTACFLFPFPRDGPQGWHMQRTPQALSKCVLNEFLVEGQFPETSCPAVMKTTKTFLTYFIIRALKDS